jgi:hypothetical protein
MKKSIFFCLLLMPFLGCKDAPKNTEQAPTTTDAADKGGAIDAADLAAITDVVHHFYKWYDVFQQDDKRAINYLNSKGKATKLDNTKLAAYHAEMMKSGFISKVYIDNDIAYLKKYEAEWLKNNENNSDGPLSGLDFDRVFCGQDWDIKDYTTGAIKAEGIGANQVKATVKANKIELVKENGLWLIAKIGCE